MRVIVITNSLASNNHLPVHSAYSRYRKRLLQAGADIYEIRARGTQTEANAWGNLPDLVTLHSKATVIDRETIFIGSLNFDPRSIDINTEMGLIVDDPVLAGRILSWFASLTRPANAWRVRLDEHGKLVWESEAGRVTRQPAKTAGERVGDFLYGLILPESQL